jgi:FAD/FMN-containing dehydrogenase
VNAGVVVDLSEFMNRLVALDPQARTARVQHGLVCDHLRAAAGRARAHLRRRPGHPRRCTLGGMIGNNSCGTHSVMGGKTVDNVLSLDVVTYDGTRLTRPTRWRSTPEAEGPRGRGAEGPRGRGAEIYREVLALALRHGVRGPVPGPPERAWRMPPPRRPRPGGRRGGARGDGRRAARGARAAATVRFKAIFEPDGRMNPARRCMRCF